MGLPVPLAGTWERLRRAMGERLLRSGGGPSTLGAFPAKEAWRAPWAPFGSGGRDVATLGAIRLFFPAKEAWKRASAGETSTASAFCRLCLR